MPVLRGRPAINPGAAVVLGVPLPLASCHRALPAAGPPTQRPAGLPNLLAHPTRLLPHSASAAAAATGSGPLTQQRAAAGLPNLLAQPPCLLPHSASAAAAAAAAGPAKAPRAAPAMAAVPAAPAAVAPATAVAAAGGPAPLSQERARRPRRQRAQTDEWYYSGSGAGSAGSAKGSGSEEEAEDAAGGMWVLPACLRDCLAACGCWVLVKSQTSSACWVLPVDGCGDSAMVLNRCMLPDCCLLTAAASTATAASWPVQV